MKLALLALLLAVTASVTAFLADPAVAWLVSAAALVLLMALLARGMVSVRSSLLEATAWRSPDPADPRVGLSFDDGPDPEGTPRILDALRGTDVRATFFLVGSRVREHPALVARIVAEGHEVGCHADSHASSTPFFGPARMTREIEDCLAAIAAAAGVTPRLYRPPFLLRSPAHAGVVEKRGLVLVGMARRGHDQGEDVDADALARRVVASASPGEIVALHDGGVPGRESTRRPAADALPRILDGFHERGIALVPVSALLGERPYVESPDRGWTGRSGGGRFGGAIFAGLVRVGALRVATPLAALVAAWFTLVRGKARGASIEFRRRLHGPASPVAEWWWAFRHFHTYGRTLLGRQSMLHGGSGPPEARYDGFENVQSVVESDGGFILMSAHFGDWALAGHRLSVRDRELVVVAARGTGLGPHQVRRGAPHLRFSVIDAEGSPEVLASEVAAALRRGAAVAMHADRTMGADGIDLPFLGAPARFPTGPWMVALITGAPVVVVFGLPDFRGGVRLLLRGPLRVVRGPGMDRREAVRVAAERYVGFLETEVRREPLAWGNFHSFWRAP
jgi:peptidoglycan/xylan/chitin deacetylase (PgdA/CDA1 family)/predicted LPLAT superfamily acyltransferase